MDAWVSLATSGRVSQAPARTSVHLEVWVSRALEPQPLPGTLPTDREAWGLPAGEYPGGPYVSPAWPALGPWGKGMWRHRQTGNR